MNNFYYKKDKLNQIRGFCAMVETDSLLLAAKKLSVEPPTISKQIKSLERDLNLKLFTQELPKKKLILTEAGKMFYDKAAPILNAMDSLYIDFPSYIEENSNTTIKLAAHHTALNYIVPKYIENFKQKNKDIKFTIYNIKVNEAIEKLKNDEIDLLIHVTDKIPIELESFTLYDFKPVILVNKNNQLALKDSNKITFADLSKQNMIMLDKDNIIDIFVKLCDKYNVPSFINIVNGDWESVRNFVKLNLGIHIYSEIYNEFEEFTDSDIISKTVDHLFPRIRFQLIYKKGKILHKNIENFIESIKNFNKKQNQQRR